MMDGLKGRYTGLDDHEFDSDYEEEDRFLPQYSEVAFVIIFDG